MSVVHRAVQFRLYFTNPETYRVLPGHSDPQNGGYSMKTATNVSCFLSCVGIAEGLPPCRCVRFLGASLQCFFLAGSGNALGTKAEKSGEGQLILGCVCYPRPFRSFALT
jgi:hypothetical protein